MSGLIKFEKAFDLFKKKFGHDYSKLDIYNEFLLSKELDLFIYIDASICECIQKGTDNSSYFVDKVYPYAGYVRISIGIDIYELFSSLKKTLCTRQISQGPCPIRLILS